MALLREESGVVPRNAQALGGGAEPALEGLADVLLAGFVLGGAEEHPAAKRPPAVDGAAPANQKTAVARGRQMRLAVEADDGRALDEAGVKAVVVAGEVAAAPARQCTPSEARWASSAR